MKTSLDMDKYQNRNSVINITDRLNAGSQPFSLQQWKLAPSRYFSVRIIRKTPLGIHVCQAGYLFFNGVVAPEWD